MVAFLDEVPLRRTVQICPPETRAFVATSSDRMRIATEMIHELSDLNIRDLRNPAIGRVWAIDMIHWRQRLDGIRPHARQTILPVPPVRIRPVDVARGRSRNIDASKMINLRHYRIAPITKFFIRKG